MCVCVCVCVCVADTRGNTSHVTVAELEKKVNSFCSLYLAFPFSNILSDNYADR